MSRINLSVRYMNRIFPVVNRIQMLKGVTAVMTEKLEDLIVSYFKLSARPTRLIILKSAFFIYFRLKLTLSHSVLFLCKFFTNKKEVKMEGLIIRKAKPEDAKDLLKVLENLSSTKGLSVYRAEEIFDFILPNPVYSIFVAEVKGKVVGSVTLLLERKLIHDGGIVGHIEDVVVAKKYSGSGIGTELVGFVLGVAKSKKCYKVILDCSREFVPFYEKAGFKEYGVQMRFDL